MSTLGYIVVGVVIAVMFGVVWVVSMAKAAAKADRDSAQQHREAESKLYPSSDRRLDVTPMDKKLHPNVVKLFDRDND